MVLFFLVTYAYRFYFLELVNQTLHVRIAGVDAPEVAFSLPFFGTCSLNLKKNHFIFFYLQCGHFGKPGQPYADESLTWLRRKILGKVVYCQLLRRDQYQRVVSFRLGSKKASLTRSCVLKTTTDIECSFGSAIFSWDILFIIKEEFGA